MPWNVHYFLLESCKAYSFTSQSSEFCYHNNKYFNNRCEFSTHKQSKSGVEFVATWGRYRGDFYCMNCFYPDPQGLLALFPCDLNLVLMQCCSHTGKLFLINDPTQHPVLTVKYCSIAFWITPTFRSDAWKLLNQIILLLLVTEGKGKS